MKILYNILIIILAVMLQITLVGRLSIYNAMFNLPLLIMISLILIKRSDLAIWWLGAGLLLDLISPVKFGSYTLTFLVFYILANLAMKKFFHHFESYFMILFFIFGSIIIDIPFLFINFSWQILLGDIIYNTLLGWVFYWFIKYYLEPKSIIKIKI